MVCFPYFDDTMYVPLISRFFILVYIYVSMFFRFKICIFIERGDYHIVHKFNEKSQFLYFIYSKELLRFTDGRLQGLKMIGVVSFARDKFRFCHHRVTDVGVVYP